VRYAAKKDLTSLLLYSKRPPILEEVFNILAWVSKAWSAYKKMVF